MKIVKVIYSAKPDFVSQNTENIQKVMNDLQLLGHPGIFYHTCLSEDGKTFTHTAFFQSDEDRKVLNELPSFQDFQQQLKASGPEVPPKQEFLTFVGSSAGIFD